MFPKKCPSCGSATIKDFNFLTKKTDAVRRCSSEGYYCEKISIEKLKHFVSKEAFNIDGIGETQVNSIKAFFRNKINLEVLDELGKVLIVKNSLPLKIDGLLNNKSFLVTGKLNGISRAEVKSLIEENSGSSQLITT